MFFWVPLSLFLGTRPVMLTSTFLLFATLIWSAKAHSLNSLIAARTVAAFALSAGETMPAVVVKDIFYLHERGWWMGAYMIFFQCLPSLGVIISGFVITALGWRWHFWVYSLFFGKTLMTVVDLHLHRCRLPFNFLLFPWNTVSSTRSTHRIERSGIGYSGRKRILATRSWSPTRDWSIPCNFNSEEKIVPSRT